MAQVKIREYEIVAGPHSGTYGSVWIGKHETLGWKRALKRLHSHVLPDVIKQEAKKLQAVRSPHVVQVHEYFSEEGWGELLLMEYCPVGLDEYLRQRFVQVGGKLPYDEGREILEGVLKGLNDAHAAEVVHGDIKAANVRFGIGANEQQLGLPKLSDFGAARHLTLAASTVRGSANWMAPELLDGNQDATRLSDYFSFGVLAYLVLSGRHPFFADDPSCLTSEEDNIANPSYIPADLATLRPDVPRPVAEHIMALLSRDPGVREKSAQTLTVALSQQWQPPITVAPAPIPAPQVSEAIAEDELTAVARKIHDEAAHLFFVGYRPRDAVEVLDAMFKDIDLAMLANSRNEILANCWSLKGFIKNSSRFYETAVQAATAGLAIHPDHVSSLHVRGYAKTQLGRYAEARADLERALALSIDPAKQRQITQLLHTIRVRQNQQDDDLFDGSSLEFECD